MSRGRDLDGLLTAGGLLAGGALLLLAGKGIKEANDKAKAAAAEEELRRNTPCLFDNGISETVFNDIVIDQAKRIKRLTVEVKGAVVSGTVRSQSGISDWYFTSDFNDYGKITGKYWLKSDNGQSDIPTVVSDRIAEDIKKQLENDDNND